MRRLAIAFIVSLAGVAIVLVAWMLCILRVESTTSFTPPPSAPIEVAIMQDEPLEKIRQILDQNAALVTCRGLDGLTPVHMAVAQKRCDIAALLLDRGADVNATVPLGSFLSGKTPLIMAAARADEPMVRLLLARGAITATRDSRGETAADWARKAKREDIAQLIERR